MTAIRSEIEKAGGQAIHMVADITSFAEIDALRQQAEQQFGPIDILVANAGASLTKPGPIEQIPEEGWCASWKRISPGHF
jgi:3-oxoacyl-[acyl-carrier protein] reductase